MSSTVTPDEQPKKKVARRVVAEKRMYFLPDESRAVEADDAVKAADLATKPAEDDKEDAE